ncbi:NmrA-domain-containing protein [Schizophyllum commune Loenen D]|nr:NmrA-domain-containing protein [Schizophyllum commune Loenen D]
MPRIATVFGATGTQGKFEDKRSAVVDALLKDGTFVPRAVTRDPNSEASRALAARGAQVVAADLGDKEAVKKALSGAEVAFGVTVPFTPLSEIVQGKNMIDAAKEEGVKYFVFSSLDSMAEISKGKYTRATHFEDKVVIAKYLEESGLPNSRVVIGVYLDNFLKLWAINKTPKGLVYKNPFALESVFGYSWVGRDLGRVVTGLFKIYPEKLTEINNVSFDVDYARASLQEILDEISKGKHQMSAMLKALLTAFCVELGQPITVEPVPLNGFAPLEDMRGFTTEFDLIGGRPIPDPKLEALGIKQDGTIHDFVQQALKPHLDKQTWFAGVNLAFFYPTAGSAVVDALLKDGTFVPRAVTRDPNSAASRALAARGAQVVAADLGDKESVKKAMEGAEVAFGVTVPFRPLTELEQGKNLVDAAKETGLKFFVFSSLSSIAEVTKGKYTKASHSEDKVAVVKYLKASGVPNARVIVGLFLENFVKMTPLTKTPEGYAVQLRFHPKSVFGYSWVGHDLGPVVTGLFKLYTTRFSEINDVDFDVDHAKASVGDIIDDISKELGKPIKVERAPPTGIPDLDEAYDFGVEYDLLSGRPVPDPKLEAFGIKQDGTIQEFVRQVLKPHLDKQ